MTIVPTIAAASACALTAVSDHSGLSANRAGLLNAQSWRLIIVWLEVRVLPAPPRSPTQTEISAFVCVLPGIRAIWPAQDVEMTLRRRAMHVGESGLAMAALHTHVVSLQL